MANTGSRRIEANGLSFHVVDEGEGPAVLLLHGFPDSSYVWRHQIPALVDAGFRVIAPDLRGFGRSDKPADTQEYAIPLILADVCRIMDVLGAERADFVGHDWGGVVAWLLASLQPQRVGRLTILSTPHPATFNRPSAEQLRRSWHIMLFQFREVAEEVLRRDDWRILREWVGEVGDIDRHIEDLARPGALTAALNWYRANIPPESLLREQHSYPKIEAPTMLVWAKLDPTRSEDAMVASLDYVEGQPRYESFENTGHWIQLERPKDLNSLLIEFLTGPKVSSPGERKVRRKGRLRRKAFVGVRPRDLTLRPYPVSLAWDSWRCLARQRPIG